MSALYFAQLIAARNSDAPLYTEMGLRPPAAIPVPAVEAPVIPPMPVRHADPVCAACGCLLSVTEERKGWCHGCQYGDDPY